MKLKFSAIICLLAVALVAASLFAQAPDSKAQGEPKTKMVPMHPGEGTTVYYLPDGPKVYHYATCPDLAGKNAWLSNIYTLESRGYVPCEKCFYREIPIPPVAVAPDLGLQSTAGGGYLKRWEGSARKNTETFTITAKEWFIKWATRGDSNFAIIVRDADTGRQVDMVGNIIGSGTDESTIHGSGRFYLEIATSQPYIIQIAERKY